MEKKDKKEEARRWMKFFKDAGIPKTSAASYTQIFVENRIHKDMLSDLTVDYLRLMGINLMGDIIAILRYGKSLQQNSTRKVVILPNKDQVKRTQSSNRDVLEVLSSSSSDSASDESSDEEFEIVEVTKSSTKKCHDPKKIAKKTKNKSMAENEVKQNMRSRVVGKVISNKSSTDSGSDKKRSVQTEKRKIVEEMEVESDQYSQEEPSSKTSSPIISAKTTSKSFGSVPKNNKLRTVTENEIIGPKLLPQKKTVFERLGVETELPLVSSTTETTPQVETTFRRVISNFTLPAKSVNMAAMDIEDETSQKEQSVFKRLGGLTDSLKKDKSDLSMLQYAGILKSPPTQHASILKISPSPRRSLVRVNPIKHSPRTMRADEITMRADEITMRADEYEISSMLKSSLKASNKKTPLRTHVAESLIKNSLKSIQYRPKLKRLNVSQGIFASSSQPQSVSVKQRLGRSSADVYRASPVQKRLLSTSRKQLSQIKAPIISRGSYGFGSRSKRIIDTKKVAFSGRVEKKLVTPVGSLRSTLHNKPNVKGGVHSRLGIAKF